MLALVVAFFPADTQAKKKANVKLNKTSATLAPGGTVQLKLENNKKKVKWSSSKTSVATVSGSGLVTAKGAGNATITAKVGKKSYKCKVAVKNVVKNLPLVGAPVNTHKSFVYVLKKDKDNKNPLKLSDYAVIPENVHDKWLEQEEDNKKEDPEYLGYEYVGEAAVSMTSASITYQNFDTTVNGYKGDHRYNVNVTGTYSMPDQLSALLTKKSEWNSVVRNVYVVPRYGYRNDPYEKRTQWMYGNYTYALKDIHRYNQAGNGYIENVSVDKQAKTFTVSITDLEQDEAATKGQVTLGNYLRYNCDVYPDNSEGGM
jgi:hypothetical protein